jgi:hypothetical protein
MNGNLPSGYYTAAYHMFSQSKILNFPHGLREKLRGMRNGSRPPAIDAAMERPKKLLGPSGMEAEEDGRDE